MSLLNENSMIKASVLGQPYQLVFLAPSGLNTSIDRFGPIHPPPPGSGPSSVFGQAALNLAFHITSPLVRDLYKSLPSGSTTITAVKKAMWMIKSGLLKGRVSTKGLQALTDIVDSVGVGSSSKHAEKALSHLITGMVSRDISNLVEAPVSKSSAKAFVAELKTDLKSGAAVGSLLTTFLGSIESADVRTPTLSNLIPH